MFLLVLAYPGCPGSKAVKRSLLLLLLISILLPEPGKFISYICLTFSSCHSYRKLCKKTIKPTGLVFFEKKQVFANPVMAPQVCLFNEKSL